MGQAISSHYTSVAASEQIANRQWQIVNSKWHMADGRGVAWAAELDPITTSFEFQGL
jgi:hypothetical protein